MRRFLVCFPLLSGCNEHELQRVELTRRTQWVAGTRVSEGPTKVDVLLVVDDSPSMHDQAGLLADNLQALAEVYERERLDYRIGVITTDVSGPDCAAGRDGALVRTSCRERLESFVTSANHESPAVDLRNVCTDSCALNHLETEPTAVDGATSLRSRGWMERGSNGQNVADPIASLTCLGQVGFAGCRTESPLGAVTHLLRRTEDPDDPDFGFVRPDAGLAIMFIGDEDDCTRASAQSLRTGGPVSAACWRSGAGCALEDGSDSCEQDGSPALVDVGAFVEQIQMLDAKKRRIDGRDRQRVFVSAVAGVPSGYPERPQVLGPGDDPDFEHAFGVGAACDRGDAVAAPSVRTVEVAEAFAPWVADVVSVCDTSWLLAVSCLPDSLRPFCLEVDLLEDDAELAESCLLTERRGDDVRRLPECVEDCSAGVCAQSPAVPEGADACVAWRRSGAQTACVEEGLDAEAIVIRLEPRWETLEYEVTCATEL